MCRQSCVSLSRAGHEKLMAVKQQQLLFDELRDTFARRLTNHLNNVFVHQVTHTHTHLTLPFQARHFSPGFLPSLSSGGLTVLTTLSHFLPACAARAEPPSLCSLSSSQFNHFSHFKMTLPQFYRSSRLSLPVSIATLLPAHLVASLLTFPDLSPISLLIASEALLTACIRRAVYKQLRGQSLSFSSPYHLTPQCYFTRFCS